MKIFFVISPLIIIGFIGFLTTKYNRFNKAQIDSLSKFTFNIAIPAYMFQLLANTDLSKVDLTIYAAFYLPIVLLYALAWSANFYFHQNFKTSTPASAIYALGCSHSNNVVVGMPVAIMVLGEQVLPIISIIISLHAALLFGITSLLTANEKNFQWQKFFKQIFYNPLLISVVSGFTFNLLGFHLPSIINDSLLLLGRPAITLALFLLGASLTFYKINSEIKFILFASILKLILLPLMVFSSCHFIFQFDSLTTTILVILSASPTAVNAYLVAKQQTIHQDTVAGIVVVTTLLSVVTLPLWIWLLSQTISMNG